MRKFVCFGEVLWDVFPDHKVVGGAPLNVALRLHSLGNSVKMISRIGRDELGEKLLEFLSDKNFHTDHIQTDARLGTGEVSVYLDENGSASYEILFPKAWDFIAATAENLKLVSEADVFVFGSLSARNPETRNTLLQLVDRAKFPVFDVNLRLPHYAMETLELLLEKAAFVKFNDEELLEIASGFGSGKTEIQDNIGFISDRFDIPQICVTRGSKGAFLFTGNQFFDNPGYAVKVIDTVGAGDSFLATLLHFLPLETPEKALDYACAMGALVTASAGANPVIPMDDMDRKISGN